MEDQVKAAKDSSGEALLSLDSQVTGLVGRELDAAVAERVMGWTWDATRCEVCGWPLWADVPAACHPSNCSMRPRPSVTAKEKSIACYSTDIAAAMEVVDKMQQKNFGWAICTHKKGWYVRCFRLPDQGISALDASVVNIKLTEAICRTALAAVARNVPERDAETNRDDFGFKN